MQLPSNGSSKSERSGGGRSRASKGQQRGSGGQQSKPSVQLDDAALKQQMDYRVSVATRKEAIAALRVAKNLAEDAKQFLTADVAKEQRQGVHCSLIVSCILAQVRPASPWRIDGATISNA